MNEVELNDNDVLYIGADVHERETQLAIFEPGGSLLQEKRIPTKDLQSYVRALPAKEKHLALESLASSIHYTISSYRFQDATSP